MAETRLKQQTDDYETAEESVNFENHDSSIIGDSCSPTPSLSYQIQCPSPILHNIEQGSFAHSWHGHLTSGSAQAYAEKSDQFFGSGVPNDTYRGEETLGLYSSYVEDVFSRQQLSPQHSIDDEQWFLPVEHRSERFPSVNDLATYSHGDQDISAAGYSNLDHTALPASVTADDCPPVSSQTPQTIGNLPVASSPEIDSAYHVQDMRQGFDFNSDNLKLEHRREKGHLRQASEFEEQLSRQNEQMTKRCNEESSASTPPNESNEIAHKEWWIKNLLTAMLNISDDILDKQTTTGNEPQAAEVIRRGSISIEWMKSKVSQLYDKVLQRQRDHFNVPESCDNAYRKENYWDLNTRLKATAAVLRYHKATCKHLLDAQFVDRFADSPIHELEVKLKNKLINIKRDEEGIIGRSEIAKKKALEEIASQTVANKQTKNPRKRGRRGQYNEGHSTDGEDCASERKRIKKDALRNK